MTTIRVPASSANLGSGFDVLGMAIDRYLEVDFAAEGVGSEDHLTMRVFRRFGGTGGLDIRSTIPPARGMGFSGAARVAGLLAAAVQKGTSIDECRRWLFLEATELEGHPDNVAPSVFGGVTVAVGDRVEKIPLGVQATVVLWIPDTLSGTKESRRKLPSHVSMQDAVFNMGRAALLVAALTNGDAELLAFATEDRLHQKIRLENLPNTAAAMEAARDAGAWCSWLSGSGPTAAALCEPSMAEKVAAALPAGAEVSVSHIDMRGAVCEE
ncbi:MAG: homoserine kinase [Acidimicrobiales bacterium]